jgi:hypothetical protein
MKTLKIALTLTVIGLIISCGKDDADPSNKVVINGEAIKTINAYIDDWGTDCYGPPTRVAGCTETHYTNVFMFTDATLNGEVCWPNDQAYYVRIILYSPNTTGLMEGTFTIDEQIQGNQSGNFFGSARISWDSNSDYAQGSVTVTGEGPEYKVRFDLTSPDAEIKGVYNGPVAEQGICD